MIDYTHGYKSIFYIEIIDPITWSEISRAEIKSGSIQKTKSDIRQSASLTMTQFDEDQEYWIRIYMDAIQNENIDHNALFTGISTSPERKIDGVVITKEIQCFSVLKPLADIILPRGWYISKGANTQEAIKQLLKDTPAPKDILPEMPPLDDYLIAEDNDTELTMLDRVLDAVGYEIMIDGTGKIAVQKKEQIEVMTFGNKSADIIEKSLTVKRDWFSCPNIFRATSGDAVAVAKDEDPNDPLSISSRGREIIMQEDDVTLGANEGIAEYAKRRLKEEQSVMETVSYSRRYYPGVEVGDMVQLDYDQIKGAYTVTAQTINLTYNARTEEEAQGTYIERKSESMGTEPVPTREAVLLMPDGNAIIFADNKRLLINY